MQNVTLLSEVTRAAKHQQAQLLRQQVNKQAVAASGLSLNRFKV
jgi:hypothetical protein